MRPDRQRCPGLAVAVVLALATAAVAHAEATHLLVVSGLGGEDSFSESFLQWAIAIGEAAEDAGIPAANVRVLAEYPMASAGIAGKSTRENVLAALAEMNAASSQGDHLWLVLIGHGSYDQGVSKLSLAGPDLTDGDLLDVLDSIEERQLAVINTSSASGGFVATLSGPNRVIVTATKSPAQKNQTVFGQYFAEALGSDSSDQDEDGAISLLEAFHFASDRVARHYESERLLRTEHALLDDNGDRNGSANPQSLGGESGNEDGLLAHRMILAQRQDTELNPEQEALSTKRRTLTTRLDQLRRQRSTLSASLYQQELESLLIEIAKIDRELRAASATERVAPIDSEEPR